MVETINKPSTDLPTVWSKYNTIKPTSRIGRLRERYLNLPNKITVDIAWLRVKSRNETEGELLVIRRAKSFAEIVRGVPINIYPDELFVGWLFSEPRGTEIPFSSITTTAFGLERELDTISTREMDPFIISEKDKKF